MSKYTTEVRYICEMKSGIPENELDDYTVDEIIERARRKVFNFSYPIYDWSYRGALETKILKHYYTREICAETVGLWQLWLNAKMNEIMPKYNKLYQKEREIIGREFKNIDVDIDQLRTDDLLKEIENLRTDNLIRTDNFTKTNNLTRTDDLTRTDNLHHVNTHNDTNKRRYSDTPQGTINFADADTGNVWLTDYERNDNTGGSSDDNTGNVKNTGTVKDTGTVTDNGTSKNTGTQRNDGSESNTGTVKNVIHEIGYRGGKAYYEMLADYENKIVNIDLMIINELNDLFFGLW